MVELFLKTSDDRFLPSGQHHMTSGNSSVNAIPMHARTRADAKAEVHAEQTPFTYPSIVLSEFRFPYSQYTYHQNREDVLLGLRRRLP